MNELKQGSDFIVLIGASYARNWDLETIAGLPLVNKGSGGEETHEMLARFDRDVIAAAPRAVVIWGFINDIFRSTHDEIDTKLVKSRQNLLEMIDRATAHGIKPIVVTEVTITTPDTWKSRLAGMVAQLRGKQGYYQYVNRHVRETNRWLRDIAAARELDLLDFETTLADESGTRRREYANQDGSHLSAAAYRALTEYTDQADLGRDF